MPGSKDTHSFCIWMPENERFHLQLAERLAKKFGFRSTGELMRELLKKALIDNHMLDEEGYSLVRGVGPSRTADTKKALLEGTSLTMKRSRPR